MINEKVKKIVFSAAKVMKNSLPLRIVDKEQKKPTVSFMVLKFWLVRN